MKILILNWKDIRHPQVGGAEIIVYELARRLVADGFDVTWFCRGFIGGPPAEDLDGIHVVRRGNLLTTYLYAAWYYWSLPVKPDLVIDISNTIFWQSPVWAVCSKRLAYLNQLARDVFYYEFPRGISRLGMLAERLQYLTYRGTSFVCYADSTKQDLEQVGIPARQIHTFPLGVDHLRYKPGKKSSTPLFICANRLVNMKRTDLAIRAMDALRRSHPGAKLVIVGTGYARKALESLRDSLHLQQSVSFADENVWFFQSHSQDQKVRLMQQAWALIFPSVKEGWGMTVTECAACGTPAIVSDVSGLRDSVQKDQTGLILSANPPPAEIAAAMARLIDDSPLRLRLSKAAIQRSKTFSWEDSYLRFKSVITGI